MYLILFVIVSDMISRVCTPCTQKMKVFQYVKIKNLSFGNRVNTWRNWGLRRRNKCLDTALEGYDSVARAWGAQLNWVSVGHEFSTLKLIRTNMWSSMSQITSLNLLPLENEIAEKLDFFSLIKEFANRKSRKLIYNK